MNSMFDSAVLLYFIIINIAGVIINISDKRRAVKGEYRIPENILWMTALAGGSIGTYLTMKMIRHKTKHKRFMIGLPIIIFLQAIFLIYILYIILGWK